MCSNKTHSFARAIEKWFAGLREVSYNDTKRVSGKEFKQLFPSESRAFSYDFRKMKSINDNDLYYIAKVDGAMRPITRQVSFTETAAPTKCGGLCRNAKGPSCDCSCKGVNHGAGSVFARSPSASVSTPQKPNLDDINIVARGYGQRAHKAGATKYNDDAQMMGFKKVYTARLKKEWVDYGKPLPDSFLMKLDKAFFDGWNSGWTLYSIDRSEHPPKYEVGQSVYWDVGSHTQPAVITRVNKFVSPIEYLIEVAAGNRGKVNVSEDSITMTPKKSPHLRFARSSASTKALRTIYNYLEVVRTEWGEDRGIEAGRELQKAAKAIAADPSSQDIAAEIAQLVRVATTDKSYDKRDRALDDLESIINQAQSQHARRKGNTSMTQKEIFSIEQPAYDDSWRTSKKTPLVDGYTAKERKAAMDAYRFAVSQEDRYLGSVFVTPSGQRKYEEETRAAYLKAKKLNPNYQGFSRSGVKARFDRRVELDQWTSPKGTRYIAGFHVEGGGTSFAPFVSATYSDGGEQLMSGNSPSFRTENGARKWLAKFMERMYSRTGTFYRSGVKSLMQKEYVLWGVPEGETDQLHAKVLSTQAKTPSEMDEIKRRASAAGWHSFRVQILDPDKPTRMFSRTRTGNTSMSHFARGQITMSDIFSGYLGNGESISNRAREVNGDYEPVAHIQYGGAITWRIKDKSRLDPSVIAYIEKASRESAAKKSQGEPLAHTGSGQGIYSRSRSRKKSLFAHWTDTTKVIETFRWVNVNGSTASSGGSVPWRTAAEKQEWHQEPYFVFYSSASGSTFGGIYKQERDAQSALDKAKKDHAAEVAKYVTAPSIRKRISELENEISGVKNQPSLAGGAVRVGRLQSELTRLQSELGGLGFAREQSEISTRFGSIASKLGFLPDSITESNGVATLKFAQADGSAGRCAFAMIRPLTGIVGSDRVTATDTEVRVQFARGGKATFGSDVILEDIGDDQVRATARVEGRSAGSFDGPRSQSAQLLLKALKIAGQGHEVSSGVYDMTYIKLNDAAKRAMPKSAMMSRGGKAEFAMGDPAKIADNLSPNQRAEESRYLIRMHKLQSAATSLATKMEAIASAAEWFVKDITRGGLSRETARDMDDLLLNAGNISNRLKVTASRSGGKVEFAQANQQIADGVAQLLSVLGFAAMAEEAKTATDADTLKRYINVARRRIKGSDQADRFNTLADKLERMLMSRGGGKAGFGEIGSGGSYVSNALHHISNDITRGDKDMAKAMMRKLAERIGKESHTDAEWHQYLSLARSLGFSDNAVAGFSRSKTKTRFEMDQTTHRHLMAWIDNQLGNRAGSAGYIADKMIGTFNDDPEHWENQGWTKVFDAAGLSSADFNNPKKGWD